MILLICGILKDDINELIYLFFFKQNLTGTENKLRVTKGDGEGQIG